MVGGGTVHWQGWLPRFTPNDFRLRTIAGELKGATLADWPISYDELEPYYAKVEWAFGVSGRAGANRFEGPRSVGYPCPPLPLSRYAEKFHKGCDALGWNAFPTPQAALSRHYNGRKPTVISAFAQQHGDPTGTRSSALNVFVPDAVKTGRYDLRPGCYVRELALAVDGAVKSAVYQDADGDIFEQEADVFILACGAVESARLLLLSKSGRFPNGLANGSDLVGRNATFHEYSAAVGLFDDPIYAWAGGGYVSSSSFQFYEHDANSRPCQRRPSRLRRRRHTLADQLAPAGCADLGRGGQAERPRQLQSLDGCGDGAARHAAPRQSRRPRRQGE